MPGIFRVAAAEVKDGDAAAPISFRDGSNGRGPPRPRWPPPFPLIVRERLALRDVDRHRVVLTRAVGTEREHAPVASLLLGADLRQHRVRDAGIALGTLRPVVSLVALLALERRHEIADGARVALAQPELVGGQAGRAVLTGIAVLARSAVLAVHAVVARCAVLARSAVLA